MTATLPRVPEPRDITEKDADAVLAAMRVRDEAQEAVEKAVAAALKHGASAPAIQDKTGLSPNTIYKYGRAHGWPTAENRANFNKSRYPRSAR